MLKKLPFASMGAILIGLVFSTETNAAQLIRQEFEGDFSRIQVSPLLTDIVPENSNYSGFVLFSENGVLEDWQINVEGLDLNLDPDSTLGSGLIPDISFDIFSSSDWSLLVDFGIAFDAPMYTLERDASEITFIGKLGSAGVYTYQDSSATISETSTVVPEPSTFIGSLLASSFIFKIRSNKKPKNS